MHRLYIYGFLRNVKTNGRKASPSVEHELLPSAILWFRHRVSFLFRASGILGLVVRPADRFEALSAWHNDSAAVCYDSSGRDM